MSVRLFTNVWIRAVRTISKGQTMTEYALILAAVAIIVFAVYEVMGQNITTLVNQVDNALAAS